MTFCLRLRALVCAALALVPFAPAGLRAQAWDVPARFAGQVASESASKVQFNVQFRSRYECRGDTAFGSEPSYDAGLFRTRLGVTVRPVSWLKLSGTVQDTRAPFYGGQAPSSLREGADLYEGFVEFFPERERGFGISLGRSQLNYGEGRLLGSPQWGNVSRTFDQAHVSYRLSRARLDFLFASPVKIRAGSFNRPVLGDHVCGLYSSFPGLVGKSVLDVYVLRHEQNRPGGFLAGIRANGTDHLTVDSYGARVAGPVLAGMMHSAEAVFQTGHVGAASHRAMAWYSNLTRSWTIAGMKFEASGDYKYASGSSDPHDPLHSGTFDQMYGSYHHVFGFQDLFGWKNLHNARAMGTLSLTRKLSLTLTHTSNWLASTRESLYNGSGKAILKPAAGNTAHHVGGEVDVLATYNYQHFQFGAGYGYFFAGEVTRIARPGTNPVYAYVFQSYGF